MKKPTISYQIAIAAIFASMAAVLQTAGGILPIIGFIISPFSTLPIALAMNASWLSGVLAYGGTILLLSVIQPGELFIFPFTTGILGLAIGIGIRYNRRIIALILSSLSLSGGISFLLYILDFPVLGRDIESTISIRNLTGILLFSIIYSWFWHYLFIWLKKRGVGR